MIHRINIFLIFVLSITRLNALSENTHLKSSPVGDALSFADSSAIGTGDRSSSIGLLLSQMLITCKICNAQIEERGWAYVNHLNTHMNADYRYKKYLKFDFDKLIIWQTMNIKIVKKNIINFLFAKNKRLNPSLSRICFINNLNLNELYSNIFAYTSFLDVKCNIKERIFCILNNITEYRKCKCGKEIKKIHFKGKIDTWYYNQYCSQSCANRYTNYKKPKSFYKNISIKAVKTRRKNGSYNTEKNRNHMIEMSRDDDVKEKRKKTNLLRYGVENAGVLGAYSSKEAEKFIRNYIKELRIDKNRCYFKNGGINGKEYFQMIYDDKLKKKKYVSYDLVVMSEDLSKIDFVFEYNGGWHYTEDEMLADPNGQSTPYKNCKTKMETYNHDLKKLSHIFKKTNDVRIYWWKTKSLVKYTHENQLGNVQE